jgi:KTSC domain
MMNDVKMTPVGSSNIKAIGRDGDKLRVEFFSGSTWEYDDASHHYDKMLDSSCQSVGKYFHANVRNNHTGRKVS